MITVKAKVYRPGGREKSDAKLRAEIAAGPFNGLKVSCSREMRDSWQPGQTIEATGAVVSPGSLSAYFRAREIIT